MEITFPHYLYEIGLWNQMACFITVFDNTRNNCIAYKGKYFKQRMVRGGGGGGKLTPNFGMYVPRQSETWAKAPEQAPGRVWKCGAPERAWAVLSFKMGAPERAWSILSVKMGVFETDRTRLANSRRCQTLCVRAEPAVGGDERVEIKEILKIMVSGTAKSAKKYKMVMLRNGFFWKFVKMIMLQNGNSGLEMGSLARHIPTYIYM